MRYTFLLAGLLAATLLSAQEYPVSTGFIIDCGGFLVDNGLSASDYGPNENSTTTICPDGTGDPVVNLYFASFNLGTGDVLEIYDGTNMNAALIGSFTGSDLQGDDIYASGVSGCLTVHFTSNGDASVGSFGAEISCGFPCVRPVPSVTSNQAESNPILLCVGEEFTLDGSGSTFGEGTSLASFTWDFDDGTENTTSWPTVSHSFSQPGAYMVQLYLTDDNDCHSAFLPDVLVFVSTTPDIEVSANDYQVCVGQEVDITGEAEAVNWSAIPEANFGGALYIPDDQSQCFSDELVFGGFDAGATVNAASDLESFYIDFEHSFMGDLVISFVCPNGQSLVVHSQGGGGTFLGIPIDDDFNPNPGTGWDYYWSPDASNGTWAENIGSTLPSGTYESFESFNNLIGCPLNGAWTVEVCDMWGSDDGFIFDWSVQFAEYLYPELISFTPGIGDDCDSTYWSGPFITDDGGLCDDIHAVITEPGSYTYTYTVMDSHGCVFTDDIQVSAFPGPIADAGEDVPYCGEPVGLSGSVTNPVQGINYTYSWSPSGPLSGAGTPTPTVNQISASTSFVLSVQPSSDPLCVVTDTVLVFIPETPQSVLMDSLELCAGADFELVAPDVQAGYIYQWYYTNVEGGLYEEVGDDQSTHQADQGGFYMVHIIEPECGFGAASQFFVETYSCEITIPNIFTPNGDGDNDSFVILGLENFPRSSLRVYNRWGSLVYEDDNYRNDWSPADVSEGTYYFMLGLQQPGSGTEYYEGYVMILRK